MATGRTLKAWHSIALIIFLLLHTTGALELDSSALFSASTPQVIARAEEGITLEPYTGIGAVPTPQTWDVLSKRTPLYYLPPDSNINIQLTLRDNRANAISAASIHNMTVRGLAKVASLAVANNGDAYLHNSTFAMYDTYSTLQFVMTTTGSLPVHAVADVLRGMQELTHYLFFLELTFKVFRDTSPTASPIASGELAFTWDPLLKTGSKRDLVYFNSSAANASTVPLRELFDPAAPAQLIPAEDRAITVTYQELKDALPVYDQSFADVATRMLADVTSLVIAGRGDGPLPFPRPDRRRVLRTVDTWGSNLAVSLLPTNTLGLHFTLSQAAMTLKAVQDNFSNGPMVESKLKITVGGIPIGWGCLIYSNTSGFRCSMVSDLANPRVGSQPTSVSASS